MRVYISGPITGLLSEEAERLFADAAEQVAARGHEPVNPLLNGLPDTATWSEHMRADIRLLLDCDESARRVLPGNLGVAGCGFDARAGGTIRFL